MNKLVYVRKEDEEVWEKAQELSGDEAFGHVVADALRDYVARREAEANGYEVVTLRVGNSDSVADATHPVQFIGRLLYRQQEPSPDSEPYADDSGKITEIYHTRKGKFAVYEEKWSKWQGGWLEAELDVYDSLEELQKNVPDYMVDRVREALGEDLTEYLDI